MPSAPALSRPGERWTLFGAALVLVLVPLAQFLWNPWAQRTLFPLFLALTLLVLLPRLFSRARVPLPDWPAAAILFAALAAVSSLVSPDQESGRLFLLFLFDLLSFFWVLRTLDRGSREFLKMTFCSVLCVYFALYLFAYSGAGVGAGGMEVFLNHNVVASLALFGFFTALDLAVHSDRRWGAAALLALAALVLTKSKGGWASLALGAGTFFCLRDSSPKKVLVWIASVLVTAGAGYLLLQRFGGSSWADRARWWSAAIHLSAGHPLLGTGPGTFERASAPGLAGGLRSMYAHSLPLQDAAELGLPAALALLAFYASGILRSRSRWIAAGLAAVLFQSLFDFCLNVPGLALFYWFLLAISLPDHVA